MKQPSEKQLHLFRVWDAADEAYYCGYIDGDGNVVIPPKYDFAEDFSEGLAAVEEHEGDGIGFINSYGEMVIPPKFNAVIGCGFSDGLCAVTEKGCGWNGKWGYIDRIGRFVIPPKYFDAGPFFNGVAPVQFIDDSDVYPAPLVAIDDNSTIGNLRSIDDNEPSIRNSCGFIDKKGNIVVPLEYELPHHYQQGRLLHLEREGEDYYFDLSGKQIWPKEPDGKR